MEEKELNLLECSECGAVLSTHSKVCDSCAAPLNWFGSQSATRNIEFSDNDASKPDDSSSEILHEDIVKIAGKSTNSGTQKQEQVEITKPGELLPMASPNSPEDDNVQFAEGELQRYIKELDCTLFDEPESKPSPDATEFVRKQVQAGSIEFDALVDMWSAIHDLADYRAREGILAALAQLRADGTVSWDGNILSKVKAANTSTATEVRCEWCSQITTSNKEDCIHCGATNASTKVFFVNDHISKFDLQRSFESRFYNLEPIAFERLIGALFQAKGYSVQYTPYSGDYGVDVLATKDGKTKAIQVKQRTSVISSKEIGELLVGQVHYEVDSKLFITGWYFSENAKETAKRAGVEIWDWDKLSAELVSAIPAMAEPYNDNIKRERQLKVGNQSNSPLSRIGCLLGSTPLILVIWLFWGYMN